MDRRGWSLSLGRVLGFPVDVHVSLLVLLGAMLFFGGDSFGLAGLALAVLTFGSVLVHELGHSVVARALGVPIAGISLFPFGGVAKMAGMPRGPKDEIAIAAAGPIVSLVLAGLFAALSGVLPGVLGAMAVWLTRINGMLGLFNLLPALPMDGGRVYRAVLALKHPFLEATVKAVALSRWVAWGMIGFGLLTGSVWLAIIGGFVWYAANREEAGARAGLGHYERPHDRPIGWESGYRLYRDPFGNIVVERPPD